MKLALASEAENTEFIKEDGSSNLENPLFKKTLEIRYQMEKVDKSAVPYTDIMSQKLHYRNQFFNQDASTVLIGSWMNTELGERTNSHWSLTSQLLLIQRTRVTQKEDILR